jgi:hypothetical protein
LGVPVEHPAPGTPFFIPESFVPPPGSSG